MWCPRLGVRQRILAACLVISLVAVAALTVFGVSFRGVLRARARESCLRLANVFAEHAHDRLLVLAGETAGLAEFMARPAPGDAAEGRYMTPGLDGRAALCSWSVYDAEGRRQAGQCSRRLEQALARAGIGGARIAPRERDRLAAAVAGHASTVLVPDGETIYALMYRPVRAPGRAPAALQAATEVVDCGLSPGASPDGARAILRPFVISSDRPRVVSVGGRPRLVVHRPLVFGGRQLGTVAAAVPFDAELRCAQGAALAIVVIAIGSLLLLAVMSYLLTDVAMVPLERIRSFVRGHQSGREAERPDTVPGDAVGTLLEAYEEMIDQSQEFADRLMESNRALRDMLTGSVGALVSTIEAKDRYTAGHSQRVADSACAIARRLGWTHADIEQLRLGALLHDVGKIGLSQDVLNKPGELTEPEWELVRQHPLVGARILSSLPGCEDIVRTILHHHEHFDGSGYPSGLAGDEIPAAARIVAVADVYDALTSRRSYRPAFGLGDAVDILQASSGTSLDPEILQVFLSLPRPATAQEDAAREPDDAAEGEQLLLAAPAPPAAIAKGTP